MWRCSCSIEYLVAKPKYHSEECENAAIKWFSQMLSETLLYNIGYYTQKGMCSGGGYAHGPHGGCSGWRFDRT